MKRTKKNSATSGNIIFDDDITITSGSYSGLNLANALEDLHTKTSKLSNYLKWIYKYGGVGGTGGGGNGNTSSSYSIYAELNGRQVVSTAGSFINLGSSGTYPLLVKISRPGGASYRVVCTFTDNSGTVVSNTAVTLNLDNNYSLESRINITKNGTLSIKVTDSIFNETTSLNTKYITDPYKFTGNLVNSSGNTYSNEIFTTNIQNNGLYLRLSYYLSVKTDVTYRLTIKTPSATYNTTSPVSMENLDLETNNEYFIDLKEFLGNFNFEFNEQHSGNYTVSIELLTRIEGEVESTSYVPVNTPISFTCVPETLYLLVQPVSGEIFQFIPDDDDSSIPDSSKFAPGSVSFRVKPYFGSYYSLPCTIEYKPIDETDWSEIPGKFRSEDIVTIYVTKPGLSSISFRLSYNGSTFSDSSTYYFYIRESTFAGGWWYNDRECLKDSNNVELSQYFRLTEFSDKFEIFGKRPIEQTINRDEITISGLGVPNSTNTRFTTIINIGLEYNEINDSDSCIFTMGSSAFNHSLKLYQDHITLTSSSSTREIDRLYIPKTDVSSLKKVNGNSEHDYHLISIVCRPSSNTSGKEFVVYIDGIIETCPTDFVFSQNAGDNLKIDTITLEKVNALVNLIDVTYFAPIPFKENEEDNSGYYESEDITIYQYYLKYKSTLLGKATTSQEQSLLTYYRELVFNPKTGDVYSTLDGLNNISSSLSVPTLVISVDDANGNYKQKLGAFYKEDSTEELDAIVTLQWSGLGESKQLTPITLPKKTKNNQGEDLDWSQNVHFHIKIQGSSTKGYRIKNYTLYLENDDADSSNEVHLFSPNFKNDNTDTFLPERSFTLKADVVDSSHSNNTSIGRFVNEITTKFNTRSASNANRFAGYVKNCLTGFPFIIFMRFVSRNPDQQDNNYYYHGVYNFNLGRESNYNLGYRDLSVFCDDSGNSVVENAPDNGFCFFMTDTAHSQNKTGLITAEIQGNSNFLDFSQYHSSVLFEGEQISAGAVTTMFGRITNESPDASFIHGSDLTVEDCREILQGFVKNVSHSGGYIFNELKKTFSEDSSTEILYGYGDGNKKEGNKQGYSAVGTIKVLEVTDETTNTVKVTTKKLPLNQVPNYKHQFKRTATKGFVELNSADDGYEEPNSIVGTISDLQNLVLTEKGEEGSNIIHWLDYRSACEYYTVCMAFGLIDSVQKNLTLKTWSANKSDHRGTFYVAFYDMDTCLGIDNAGKSVNYTAFSDYWEKEEVPYGDGGNTVAPKSVIVYRDYSPSGSDYFDVASSYLFAIPKYSAYIAKARREGVSDDFWILANSCWPRLLWAKWRSLSNSSTSDDPTRGCLESAEYFIENYFSNNLGSVGIPLINANYRAKYLVELYIDTTNSEKSLPKFNGTRIAKVKEWLSNRFHLLDAYFNIVNGNSIGNPVMFYRKVNDENLGEYYTYTPVLNDNDTDYYMEEPRLTDFYTSGLNPDVLINTDIFENTEKQTAITISALIKAKENSPLIVTTSNTAKRYLIGGDKYYQLTIPISGTQQYKLYGSKSWTYLSSIDNFYFKTFSINSQYIDQLVGTTATNDGLRFDNSNNNPIIMPSLKTLSLTSPKYSGFLRLYANDTSYPNCNYPNLNSVDLSNSAINLDMKDVTCTTLNLSNVIGTANDYSITNCAELTTINLTNARMRSLVINRIHQNLTTSNTKKFSEISSDDIAVSVANDEPFGKEGTGFSLNGTNIGTLNLTNNTNTEGKSRLEILNDNTLSDISVRGFSVVVIKNCGNLSKVTIVDPTTGVSGDKLRRLCIQDCGSFGSDLEINSSDLGNLDLTGLSELDFVNFRECSGIHSVKFASGSDSNVYLDYDAFYNDTNLITLDGKASILGSVSERYTFYACRNFTLQDSNETCCNLRVIPSATSIESLFSVGGDTESYGKINLESARSFIENGISDENVITSIASLFHGQNIVYDLDLLTSDLKNNTKNYIDMSKFRKVTNISSAFNYNKISAWHPKWFTFGQDVTEINGFNNYVGRASSVVVSTVSNVLFEIIEKIKSINGNNDHTNFQYLRIKLVNANGSGKIIENFKATDFFFPTKGGVTRHPLKVTYITCFSFSADATVDFDGLFNTGWWKSLNYLNRFEYETNSGGSNYVNNIYNIDGLFYSYSEDNLPPLSGNSKGGSIVDSFRIGTTPLTKGDKTADTFIDLYNFINWNKYRKNSVDFFRRDYTQTISDYSDGNFTVLKYITLENFNRLCNILFSSDCSWTGFSNLFRNCTVICDKNSSVQIYFPNIEMNSVKIANSLFDKFRVIKKDLSEEIKKEDLIESTSSSSEYIEFDFDHLMGTFPNLTSAAYAFRGVKFKTALPINFWKKRQKSTEEVYVRTEREITEGKDGEVHIGSSGLGNKQYVFEYSGNVTDEDANAIIAKYFTKATRTFYTYRSDLILLAGCFYNAKWYYGTINGTIYQARNFDPSQLSTIQRNSITVDGTDVAITTKGTEYSTMEKKTTITASGTLYSRTFTNKVGGLEDSTEFSDIEELTEEVTDENGVKTTVGIGDYTRNLTIINEDDVHVSNYVLGDEKEKSHEISESHATSRSFIAPDILYPCASTATITNFLYSNGTDSLEGMIPRNLLKSLGSNVVISGLLTNHSIIPRKFGTITTTISNPDGSESISKVNYYTFVPEGFTSATILDSVFRFKILLPKPDNIIGNTTEVTQYYILLNSSLTNKASITSIQNAFPSYLIEGSGTTAGLWRPSNGEWFNTANPDYNILRYGLMYNPIFNSDGDLTGGSEGISLSEFRKTKFDLMLVNDTNYGETSSVLVRYLTGNIFQNGTNFNSISRKADTPIIGTFKYSTYQDCIFHFNCRLILPGFTGSAGAYKDKLHYIGFSGGKLLVHKSQLPVGNKDNFGDYVLGYTQNSTVRLV